MVHAIPSVIPSYVLGQLHIHFSHIINAKIYGNEASGQDVCGAYLSVRMIPAHSQSVHSNRYRAGPVGVALGGGALSRDTSQFVR